MKRYRIEGQSVLSSLDRPGTLSLISELGAEGLLECCGTDMHSVEVEAADGHKYLAHITSGEVALISLPGDAC